MSAPMRASQLRIVERGEDGRILAGEVAALFVQVHFAADQVHDALQARAHADRPGHRRALDAEHAIRLRRAGRSASRPSRSSLLMKVMIGVSRRRHTSISLIVRSSTPLAHVDHHQRRVDRGQHAVGVLAEVGVAGRVEQVDDAALVRELHHRAGHRDAALLFQRHPVGRRVARGLARLHRAGHLDRAAEQQQLLGQRGLAGVGVGNDREGAAARGFGGNVGHADAAARAAGSARPRIIRERERRELSPGCRRDARDGLPDLLAKRGR